MMVELEVWVNADDLLALRTCGHHGADRPC